MDLSFAENFVIYSRYIPGLEGTGKYKSPFRKESVPSFDVDLENGLWYDFGIGEGGDQLELIMRLERLTFQQSKYFIAEILRGVAGSYGRISEMLETMKAPGRKSSMPDKNKLNFVPIGKEMASYLKRRGIEYVDFMRYGYIHVIEFAGHLWLYFNYGGDQYKLMRWEEGKKVVLIGGGSLGLWNPHNCTKNFLLCEGELDAMSAMQCGYKAVSIPMGSSSFRESWFEGLDDILICFDNDHAGREGALKAFRGLPCSRKEILTWDRTFSPEGEDLNSYYSKYGNLDFIRTEYGSRYDA